MMSTFKSLCCAALAASIMLAAPAYATPLEVGALPDSAAIVTSKDSTAPITDQMLLNRSISLLATPGVVAAGGTAVAGTIAGADMRGQAMLNHASIVDTGAALIMLGG